jgi:hypothetical protein
MDLQLYARVLWRFRRVVVVGFVLAVGLSFLSYFKVDLAGGSPNITHRESEVWRSDGTLFVTQPGFPWGRIAIFERPKMPTFGDPDRFTDLATLYSYLAQSDAVRQIMAEEAPVKGEILAEPITSSEGDGLPLVGITAMASSAEAAVELAGRQVEAFSRYLDLEQARSDIPKDARVVIEQVEQPRAAALEVPRKKTGPIAIFLAAMMATLGIAFVLENLRPQIRKLPTAAVEDDHAPVELRRSA